MKYIDHDARGLTKFPKFEPDKYMKPIPHPLGIVEV